MSRLDRENSHDMTMTDIQPLDSTPELRFEIQDAWALDELAGLWRELEVESAPSFFQSWNWLGTWVELLPPDSRPRALLVWRDEQIVGLAFLGRVRLRRHAVVGSNALFLNETGNTTYDWLTIEHNGILAKREAEREVVETALYHLAANEQDWDELYLGGVADAHVDLYVATASSLRLAVREVGTKPYFTVDLTQLPDGRDGYLSRLSSNTRYQIRRSKRAYEKMGELRVAMADSVEEALEFFNKLGELHQAYWVRKGLPGAFSNGFFRDFHQALIQRCLPEKEVQLLRITAGPDEVGYLYNFVKNGVVSSYQSGFAYPDDRRIKPGLVSHALAVDFNRRQGNRVYDFLAGEGQYKGSLSLATGSMRWIALQRPRFRFYLEDLMAGFYRQLRNRRNIM